jgi:hypothetical protein
MDLENARLVLENEVVEQTWKILYLLPPPRLAPPWATSDISPLIGKLEYGDAGGRPEDNEDKQSRVCSGNAREAP